MWKEAALKPQPQQGVDPCHQLQAVDRQEQEVVRTVASPGAVGGELVAYDLATFTVTIDVSGLAFDDYTLTIADTVQSLKR